MLSKIQNFGSAMLVPVMFMSFSGIVIGVSVLFTSSAIFGDWAADKNMFWCQFWDLINVAGWTIIKQIPLVFAVGLPVGLAKKANARACLEVLILFITFHYCVNTMISTWPSFFHNIDMTADVETTARLTMVANIPTLNMGVAGSILISAIVVWIHNRYYDKKLPVGLSVFSGSVFVYMIGFFVMLPFAFIVSLLWPYVQDGITAIGQFVCNSGEPGLWIYIFLEKALMPFGVHGMLWMPFEFDNIVMDGGIDKNWFAALPGLAVDPTPIKEVIPETRFTMTNFSRIFGATGICIAMYMAAKPENKKKILGILIAAWVSCVFGGISEPLEFTFLFVAPLLFVCHAVLAATMTTLVYIFGCCGQFSGSILVALSQCIPLVPMHWREFLIIFAVGIPFIFIYWAVFYTWITKRNVLTPGREEDDEEIRLRTKKEYRDRQKERADARIANKAKKKKENKDNDNKEFMSAIEEGIGGRENIDYLTNCVSRLRITVKDKSLLKDDAYFKSIGAKGAVQVDKTIQIIIGTDVGQVRTAFEEYVEWDS